MSGEHLIDAILTHNARKAGYDGFRAYFRGNHELKFATADFQAKYGNIVKSLRENICPGIVTAFTDLIGVVSWGDGTDEVAKEYGLNRTFGMVTDESFRCGDAYVLVWNNSRGELIPHYHRADQIVPVVDPENPAVLERGTRIWSYGSYGRANIYYADRVERWITVQPITELTDQLAKGVTNPSVRGMPDTLNQWQLFSGAEVDGSTLAHDFDGVPICWFKQSADSQYDFGVSVLADVVPIQDAINKSFADMVVLMDAYSRPFWYLLNYKPQVNAVLNPLMAASELQGAFAKLTGAQTNYQPDPGSDLPTTSANGRSSQRFDPTEQQIFTHDGPGPFGQLDPPDLTKVMDAQDRLVIKAGRVVGLPSYYISQTSGDVPSGQALRVLASRMTARIGRYQRDNEPVLEGLCQLLGIEPAIEWVNPVPLDTLEKMDVAEAKKRLGYSLEDILVDLDEPDPEGVMERAAEASARAVQAFRDGAMAQGEPVDENEPPNGPNQ